MPLWARRQFVPSLLYSAFSTRLDSWLCLLVHRSRKINWMVDHFGSLVPPKHPWEMNTCFLTSYLLIRAVLEMTYLGLPFCHKSLEACLLSHSIECARICCSPLCEALCEWLTSLLNRVPALEFRVVEGCKSWGWLKALAALPEDPDPIRSTHMAAHNGL